MKEILRDSAPILILLLVCGALIGGISWWIGGGADALLSGEQQLLSEEPLSAPLRAEEQEAYQVDKASNMNPVAVMETNKGVIEVELFDNAMPITAGNFTKLAEEGFYDGIKFHRVIDGFMIQGGDPNTKTDQVFTYGQGGPGYSIPDEHIEGDLLTNARGTISMANSGPNSGGSQFFINLADNTNLDFNQPPLTSKHPVFGQVISGMDVVDKIAVVETGPSNLPVEDVVIESVTIRRN
jgi:peptidylprolyl isomerase